MASKKTGKPAEPIKGPKLDSDVTSVLDQLRASLGDEGAQILGSDDRAVRIRGVISSQCPSLDRAIGRGGIPIGRVSILVGGEGGGKTTVALHVVAEAQKMGGFATYIDEEYKMDPDWAGRLGVNKKRLIISQPGSLERVIGAIETSIEAMDKIKRKPGLVVVDSLNAAMAQAVLDGEAGDHHIAPQARLWSKHLPKIVKEAAKRDIAILLISQVRSKINVMFGDADELSGGKAPRFHASLIIKIVRTGTVSTVIGGVKHKIGNEIEATCKKNQISSPFKTANFHLMFADDAPVGIDFTQSLLQECLDLGIVEAREKAIYWDGNLVGSTLVKATRYLNNEPDVRDELNVAFRTKMGWQ